MRIRQIVYFGVRADALSPTEITERIGVEPDEFAVRGSRVADPPYPKSHSWQVSCDAPGLTVDEQIDQVMRRLRDQVDTIGALVDQSDDPTGDRVVTTLKVVRHFDSEDGEEDRPTPPGLGFSKLGGQHHLLGWHVGEEVLEFLRRTRAELDIDEYG